MTSQIIHQIELSKFLNHNDFVALKWNMKISNYSDDVFNNQTQFQQNCIQDIQQSFDIEKCNQYEQISKDIIMDLMKTGNKIVYNCTGAGSQALADFTKYPGSSAFAQEAKNVYGKGSSMIENNNKEPEKYVSSQFSEQLSQRALIQSQKIINTEIQVTNDNYNNDIWSKCIGVGVTGAIRSAQPKKGKHHCYISVQSISQILTIYINLDKTLLRERVEEEQYISYKIWQCIGYLCGIIKDIGQIAQIEKGNDEILIVENRKQKLSDFLENPQIESLTFYQNEQNFAINLKHQNSHILPGSFNPIHDGHIEMLEESIKSSQQTNNNQQNGYLEIALKNADKGKIDEDSLLKRLQIIFKTHSSAQVIVSNKTLFADKLCFLNNCNMILGMDTLKRIFDIKYYNNSQEQMIVTLSDFIKKNIQIHAFPRINPDTKNLEKFEDFKTQIPEFIIPNIKEFSNFRNDLSSTEIRKQQNL